MKRGILLRILLCVATAILVGIISLRAMQNQPGSGNTLFGQFVLAGGFIVWFIQIPLSIVTLYLIIENVITIRRQKLVPLGIAREIITTVRQFGYKQLPARMPRDNDLVTTAFKKAISYGAKNSEQLETMAAESLQEQIAILARKIEWHNVIGNISPMIGLFGTVLGMIEIFNKMGIANGQANHAQLAHGISIAWVTTFWGLLTAIPALAVHGIFRNRIEAAASEAAAQAELVILEFKRTGAFKNQNTAVEKIPIEVLPQDSGRVVEIRN